MTSPTRAHGYGYLPDLPDVRDHRLYIQRPAAVPLPPIVDLRANCPAIYDQGALGSCFPAGTRIRLANGSHKPIEQIRLLDQVVTAEGHTGTVTSMMVRSETEGLIALKLWGHNLLRMTKEHPILTQRGYIQAGELTLDDYIALPRYMTQTKTAIETSDYLEQRERIVTTGKRVYAGVQDRVGTQIEVKAIPETITLSGAFGRIIGLFLSEGNTDYGKVCWTFSQDEIVSELMMLLREELGLDPKLQIRGNKAVKVVVHGVAWAKLFERLCGTGAGKKRVAADLMSGPYEFQAAMLKGWLDGDGHYTQRGVQGVSISQDLALSMFDIANALGQRPGIRWGVATQNRHAKERQPRIDVKMMTQGDSYRVQLTDTHMWRRVRAIEHEPFTGYVYNLSVTGDESYIAEGIGVHNCVSHAVAAAIEYDQMKQVLRPFIPSRLYLYYNERRIEHTVPYDSGATIRDGFKSITRYGYCDELGWPYDIGKFTLKPPDSCYQQGLPLRQISYQRVAQELTQLQIVLSREYLIVVGISVYESFESTVVAQTGIVPMPSPTERLLGGHAIALVGYIQDEQRFIARNSWNTTWGEKGYFTIPFSYILNNDLCADLWTVQHVIG